MAEGVLIPKEYEPPTLDSVCDDVARWLNTAALPLWAERGQDASGLFHERLDFDGRPDLSAMRRMRVQARQLFVFAEAGMMGWQGGSEDIVTRGLEAFVARCWAPDGAPGWAHMLSPDGSLADPTRDTYDHAFALLALASVWRYTGSDLALQMRDRTLAFIDASLTDHLHGGLHEGLPHSLPRRANPHMHMLEAMLAWHATTGDAEFRHRADQLVQLFLDKFYDPFSETLGEFYDEAWRGPSVTERVVEPGHHFEWTWLLHEAAAQGCIDARPQAAGLYRFGLEFGLDQYGLAIDELRANGAVARASRRTWPQTELIKALVVMARDGDLKAQVRLPFTVQTMMRTYLGTPTPGLWFDQFDAQGRTQDQHAPASTFYHLVMAFRELFDGAEQIAGEPAYGIPVAAVQPSQVSSV
ncbi:AGE family epimerase/isomerase [Phenylobacterium sp.]|jgi:mannose-6-phosphate isomerase|uniref:AGE family epimerase/isomerase n=1 Tax=Phenylobacterium sp. TaxID=1871053 RepID=UPI002E30A3DD|nr:AGE family epimerase/isomerase [Phenylobacterium sp.]HEX2560668.1 AGE family epimerase/isomerase [Phenylobacterium sp.]